MSFLNRDEIKELNDTTRKDADGSFIQLRDGITHYELSNPDNDATVVLVHGFSVPYFIFDPLFKFLTDSEFRVLRYDLFGRGYSDRPRTRYNIDFFVRQLSDLLDALRLTQPVNLVGLSMGGPISATFTARFPEQVKTLTLIDPAGARAVSLTPMLKAVKLPWISDAVFGLMGSESMIKSAVRDFYDPKLVDKFISQYKVQMQFKGFQRAVLSTIRNGMLESFIETYKIIGTMDKPIALFWGRNDKTVPYDHSNDLLAAMPNVEFHTIEDCGHIPHYEKPHEFNPILLRFLRK